MDYFVHFGSILASISRMRSSFSPGVYAFIVFFHDVEVLNAAALADRPWVVASVELFKELGVGNQAFEPLFGLGVRPEKNQGLPKTPAPTITPSMPDSLVLAGVFQ